METSKNIYVSVDNNYMTLEDIEAYVRWVFEYYPERIDWTFDELTGGRSEFLCRESYEQTKSFYKNIKKIKNESLH